MYMKMVKNLQGFTISKDRNRYYVYVCGDELAFDTLQQAEDFILSGEATDIENA